MNGYDGPSAVGALPFFLIVTLILVGLAAVC